MRIRRTRASALLLGVLVCGACASPPAPEPRAPERRAARDLDREVEPEPYHVAPPPAYGNEVVWLDPYLEEPEVAANHGADAPLF